MPIRIRCPDGTVRPAVLGVNVCDPEAVAAAQPQVQAEQSIPLSTHLEKPSGEEPGGRAAGYEFTVLIASIVLAAYLLRRLGRRALALSYEWGAAIAGHLRSPHATRKSNETTIDWAAVNWLGTIAALVLAYVAESWVPLILLILTLPTFAMLKREPRAIPVWAVWLERGAMVMLIGVGVLRWLAAL